MLRTGTTFLFDLLANDTSTFRTPLTWESHFVYPPPDESNYDCDPRIEKTKKVYDLMCYFLPELMVRMIPAVPSSLLPCAVHQKTISFVFDIVSLASLHIACILRRLCSKVLCVSISVLPVITPVSIFPLVACPCSLSTQLERRTRRSALSL